ncbi:MAG: dockerin type I repeat-containing protein, partial [Methanosarcinales archaeon]
LKEVTLTTQNGKITVVCCGICGVTGDINGDGKVTSLDALMALQMSVGLIQVDQCADVNGDGIVTSVDALMILKASVGLITL